MAEITTSDLTTRETDGTGVFDELMETIQVRLEQEFQRNRITGSDYAKVYLGAMDSTLQQSMAFVLGQQQADKQADLIAAQILNATKEGALLDSQVAKITQEIAYSVKEEAKLDQDILVAQQQVLNAIQEVLLSEAKVVQMNEQALLTAAQVKKTEQEIINITIEGQVLISQAEKMEQEVLTEQQQVLNMIATVAKTTAEAANLGKQGSLLDDESIMMVSKKAMILNDVTLKSDELLISDQKILLITEQVKTETAQTGKLGAESSLIGATETKTGAETTLLGTKDTNEGKQGEIMDQEILIQTHAATVDLTKKGAILTNQASKLAAETSLLTQKTWTEEAQISDSYDTNIPVAGVIKKQVDLYAAQTKGFTRDSEQKAAKIMADAFNIRKSIVPAASEDLAGLGDSAIESAVTKMNTNASL